MGAAPSTRPVPAAGRRRLLAFDAEMISTERSEVIAASLRFRF
jgi:hypothetical protein